MSRGLVSGEAVVNAFIELVERSSREKRLDVTFNFFDVVVTLLDEENKLSSCNASNLTVAYSLFKDTVLQEVTASNSAASHREDCNVHRTRSNEARQHQVRRVSRKRSSQGSGVVVEVPAVQGKDYITSDPVVVLAPQSQPRAKENRKRDSEKDANLSDSETDEPFPDGPDVNRSMYTDDEYKALKDLESEDYHEYNKALRDIDLNGVTIGSKTVHFKREDPTQTDSPKE